MLRVVLLRVHDQGEKTSIITYNSACEKRETLVVVETRQFSITVMNILVFSSFGLSNN
jgi:hypothetical protein